MQLHSKSGLIFYNNFDSEIYYSTSGCERPSSTIQHKNRDTVSFDYPDISDYSIVTEYFFNYRRLYFTY